MQVKLSSEAEGWLRHRTVSVSGLDSLLAGLSFVFLKGTAMEDRHLLFQT